MDLSPFVLNIYLTTHAYDICTHRIPIRYSRAFTNMNRKQAKEACWALQWQKTLSMCKSVRGSEYRRRTRHEDKGKNGLRTYPLQWSSFIEMRAFPWTTIWGAWHFMIGRHRDSTESASRMYGCGQWPANIPFRMQFSNLSCMQQAVMVTWQGQGFLATSPLRTVKRVTDSFIGQAQCDLDRRNSPIGSRPSLRKGPTRYEG